MERFDLVVIGSGPGGYKAAITAAHLGARVALVERWLPGGTCLNQGCIPKKTLIHLALLLEDVEALQGKGLRGSVEGDFAAAMVHKNAVVAGIRDNFSVWLQHLGIRLFHGEAAFVSPREILVRPGTVDVAACRDPVADGGPTRRLSAERFLIATGSMPRELDVCPSDGHQVLNSRDFMFKLSELPESVLCIGGGTIGVELGFLFRQFGSRVCVVERATRLLDRPEIPDRASGILERKFKRIGIEVRKGIGVQSVRTGSGGVEVDFSDGSKASYEKVLVAVGRLPVTAGLELQNAGVATDEGGFIRVNEYLETTARGIYAIGDVKGGPMTANAALHDSKVASTNALNGNILTTNYHKVPVVINSALEIAAVGLTEEQAEAAGFEPDVARTSFGASGKARAHHDFEGFIEVVHDEETGQLLGGCIVGPEAGEQIHMMTAACQSERGLWFFKDLSYSHPSWCEEMETAIDPYTSAFARARHGVVPGIYADRKG